MNARMGTIGGTAIKHVVLDTPQEDMNALEVVFQLNDHKHQPHVLEWFDMGHKMEPQVIIDFVNKFSRRFGENLPTPTAEAFVRDKTRKYLGASPDYASTTEKLGGRFLIQCKYKAGPKSRLMKVELHKLGCFYHQLDQKRSSSSSNVNTTQGGSTNNQNVICKCLPPPDYADQMQLEIYVSGSRYNVLAVKSEINMDFTVVEKSQEWIDNVLPIVDRFYERYMAWYWEDDDSKSHLLREKLEWYNTNVVDKWNNDVKNVLKRPRVDIDVLLKKRPTGTKRKSIEEEEEDKSNKRLKTCDENEWLTCDFYSETSLSLKCLYKQRTWDRNELSLLDEGTSYKLINDLYKLIGEYIPVITPYYLIECVTGREYWVQQAWYRCSDAKKCFLTNSTMSRLSSLWLHPDTPHNMKHHEILEAKNLHHMIDYVSDRFTDFSTVDDFAIRALLSNRYTHVKPSKQRDIYLDVLSYSPALLLIKK